MIELPESIQPVVKVLVKYHFWLLAVLMPLVLVPLAFTADATLISQIDKQRQEVESKLDSVERLARAEAAGFEQLGHPQTGWAEQIDRVNEKLRKQVEEEWESFWQEQQTLRKWPDELRQDFKDRIKRLKPGDSLPPRFVERYQNTIRQVVRKLPAKLDAAEEMRAGAGGDAGGFGRRFNRGPDPNQFGVDGTSEPAIQYTVNWNPADQAALYSGFDWQKPPSTTQILLAQEELWAYETLCDAIAAANAGATGSHNATISTIDQLAVGYRAAQTSAANNGKVQRLGAAAGMGMDMGMGMGMDSGMGMGMDSGMDGAAAGPLPNPRFSAGNQPMGMGMGMGMDEGFPGDGFDSSDQSGDETLRNWIYVDATGRPLAAEEIENSPDTKLAHLVPFVVRGRVDQRKLDLLLRTLATWAVPIDVSQVRLNPEAAGSGSGNFGMGRTGMGERMAGGSMMGVSAPDSVRRYDLTVELRGSIALANPPNPEFLGLAESSIESDGPAEE